MDTAFQIEDVAARADYLRSIMQTFGCTYICLWSYSPHPFNFLTYKDGFYKEENNQPSSSSGSRAQRLFDEYRRSVFTVDDDFINVRHKDYESVTNFFSPFLFELQTVAFMGCKSGEIEIGMSSVTQINLETEMKNWFPEYFIQQSAAVSELPQPADQNRPSSSSSSLRSLSMESSEYSPLLFNIANTTYMPEPLTEAPIEQALRPISTTASSSHQQASARNFIRPNTTTCSISHQRNYRVNQNASAFKNYASSLAPTNPMRANLRRQSMLKRAIGYFKSVSSLIRSSQREQIQGSRTPTGTQLHHMISERKRREKLNESFQALRSLLPPGSKKDKASVLINTREYLSSLKSQVYELGRKNQLLEAQLKPIKQTSEEASGSSSSSTGERLNVGITQISESTSPSDVLERIVDLQVTIRSDGSMLDLMIRVLEFLKQVNHVSLMSTDGETQLTESSSVYRIVLRLKIEGNEWDESAFQEAVRRVVADLAK
ncbi:hypothetical protein L1049_023073 [Liquidambar formosana]|uniref:BHLH domain-containing protein n=1 Tax=Liquidambar formosana TaxID=63359 RepID=A0AAP0RFI8_LIQFO